MTFGTDSETNVNKLQTLTTDLRKQNILFFIQFSRQKYFLQTTLQYESAVCYVDYNLKSNSDSLRK